MAGAAVIDPTFQLRLYNGALRICEESKLASLTESRPAASMLNDVWADGAIQYCLEMGLWFFAMRRSQFQYDPEQTPNFGYACVFEKPGDWVRTAGVWQDDRGNVPLELYNDEAGFWYSDLQQIYVGFISNDPLFGLNTGLWPQTFIEYVEHYLAKKIISRLAKSEGLVERVIGKDGDGGMYKKSLLRARSNAAMAESTKYFPMGTWVKARMGRYSTRDLGSTQSLIG